jgi:hypothetical protein
MKLTAVILLILSHAGFAQAPEKSSAPKAAKKVFVSFDEDLVRGSMTGAELFLILKKKQTKFDHLFDLKEDFNDEMIRDADGIK